MGSLIKGSINLNKLPKEKLIKGKNGTYYDFTISVNDETGQFGDNCSIFCSQTKEERDAKAPKTYLGNVKVVWTNGTNVDTAPRQDQPAAPAAAPQ